MPRDDIEKQADELAMKCLRLLHSQLKENGAPNPTTDGDVQFWSFIYKFFINELSAKAESVQPTKILEARNNKPLVDVDSFMPQASTGGTITVATPGLDAHEAEALEMQIEDNLGLMFDQFHNVGGKIHMSGWNGPAEDIELAFNTIAEKILPSFLKSMGYETFWQSGISRSHADSDFALSVSGRKVR